METCRLMLAALAGLPITVLACTAAAQSSLSEPFTGPAIDPCLRSFADPGFTFMLAGGVAVLHKDAGTSVGAAGVQTRFDLDGDFTATVRAHRTNFDEIGDDIVLVMSWADGNGFADVYFWSGDRIRANFRRAGIGPDRIVANAAADATFRIRREGQAVFLEFNTGGGFVTLHSGSHVSLRGPVKVAAYMLQENGNTNALDGSIDDFVVTGDVFCAAINRQPSPARACPRGNVRFSVGTCGTAPISHQWRRSGVVLVDGPTTHGSVITGATTATLEISGAMQADTGVYDCIVSNACRPVRSDGALLTLCYPDCDCTSGPPVLDIFDFLCFQNLYAANDPYACDCDTASGPGVCDIFDFLCFQNAFAAGCP